MKFYLISEEQLQQLIDGLYNPMAPTMRELVRTIKQQNPPTLPVPPEAKRAYEPPTSEAANKAYEEEKKEEE